MCSAILQSTVYSTSQDRERSQTQTMPSRSSHQAVLSGLLWMLQNCQSGCCLNVENKTHHHCCLRPPACQLGPAKSLGEEPVLTLTWSHWGVPEPSSEALPPEGTSVRPKVQRGRNRDWKREGGKREGETQAERWSQARRLTLLMKALHSAVSQRLALC